MASDPNQAKPAADSANTAPVAPSPTPAAPAAASPIAATSSTSFAPRVSSAGSATLRLETSAPPARTVKCPKCGADAREVARFCQRCHMTLRFTCPSCKHEQRTGGTCEKCGVDFLKYIGAVVAAKKAESDATHERLEQRSTLLRNMLFIPLTVVSAIKTLGRGGRSNR